MKFNLKAAILAGLVLIPAVSFAQEAVVVEEVESDLSLTMPSATAASMSVPGLPTPISAIKPHRTSKSIFTVAGRTTSTKPSILICRTSTTPIIWKMPANRARTTVTSSPSLA